MASGSTVVSQSISVSATSAATKPQYSSAPAGAELPGHGGEQQRGAQFDQRVAQRDAVPQAEQRPRSAAS
jgi:hypothetical protein